MIQKLLLAALYATVLYLIFIILSFVAHELGLPSRAVSVLGLILCIVFIYYFVNLLSL